MPRRSYSMLRRLGTALVRVLPGLITKGSVAFQHPTRQSPRILGFHQNPFRSTVNTPSAAPVRAEQRGAAPGRRTLEP